MKVGYVVKRISCILAALAAAGLIARASAGGVKVDASPESSDYEQRLADLDRQQQELDEKLAEAQSGAASEQEKLEAVSAKLESLEAEKKELELASQQLMDDIVEADDRLRIADHQLEEQEKLITEEVSAYGSRLRALYLAGGESYANIILSSEDFFDVLMRTELVKRVASHDRDTIDALLERLHEIQQIRNEAEQNSAELNAKTKEFGEYRQRIADSTAEQQLLLEQYQAKLDELGMLSEELAAQAKQLDEERAEVSRKASEAATTTTTTTTPAATTTTKSTTAAANTTTTKKSVTTAPADAEEPEVTTPAETSATKKTTTSAAATTTPAPTAATTTTTTSVPVSGELSADKQAMINTVVNYALSNVGGTYILNAASYRACDCSGLTMLSYAQVGISIPHWTCTQAQCGIPVSYSDLRPGDLVFFGYSPGFYNVYHAAMYIGNGKIVHAMNPRDGIAISDLSRFSIYNPIQYLRRLIY